MKLAISNIAWSTDEEPEAAMILAELGLKGLEVAPTKINPQLKEITEDQIREYIQFWHGHGIRLIAMQSLLFGKPDLTLFDSEEKRRETIDYLKMVIDIGHKLDCKILVFGSPKNRNRRLLSMEAADKIAVEFFKELGDYAHSKNLKICIEHNPTDYDCNYITTPEEAFELVKKVDSQGFGLHIDSGGLILSHSHPDVIAKFGKHIAHYHISEPFLNPMSEEHLEKHRTFAKALHSIGYNNWVSIEMKPTGTVNLPKVKESIELIKNIYS
jgi:D-psicose/D-tagatose/L-ribulose 3-epimerase